MISTHDETKIKIEEKFSTHDYPKSWVKIYFKQYPRFNKIKLNTPKNKSKSLYSSILNRKSIRNFNKNPITKQEISEILYYSGGIINGDSIESLDDSRRGYPSAGARYPIEIYLSISNCKEIPKGVYHYNVISHSLELMIKGDQSKKINKFVNQEMVESAPITFILSGVLNRTQVKYGNRGYRYILLDMGHLAQNIYLSSDNLNIGCCTIGGFSDNDINEFLDFTENEQVLYMGVLGKHD